MNNLKAERTLTAERVSDERLAQLIANAAGATEETWWLDDVADALTELQSLRSQSMSTQQPMGEPSTSFQMLMDAYIRGYAWSLENRDSQALVHKAAYDYADKTTSALHPNQESGE